MYLSEKPTGRFLYDLPAPSKYRLNDGLAPSGDQAGGSVGGGEIAGGSNQGTGQKKYTSASLRAEKILKQSQIGTTKKIDPNTVVRLIRNPIESKGKYNDNEGISVYGSGTNYQPFDYEVPKNTNQYTGGNSGGSTSGGGGSSSGGGSNSGGSGANDAKTEETNWLLYGGIAAAGLLGIYLITR